MSDKKQITTNKDYWEYKVSNDKNYKNLKLPTDSEMMQWLNDSIPTMVRGWTLCDGNLKTCSSVSPAFSEISGHKGIPVYTQDTGKHQLNIAASQNYVWEIDLSNLQFHPELQNKSDRAEYLQKLQEYVKDPYKAVKIRKIPINETNIAPAHEQNIPRQAKQGLSNKEQEDLLALGVHPSLQFEQLKNESQQQIESAWSPNLGEGFWKDFGKEAKPIFSKQEIDTLMKKETSSKILELGKISKPVKIESISQLSNRLQKEMEEEKAKKTSSNRYFHGTSTPVEKLVSPEEHQAWNNIFGNGFYTTDDIDLAKTYTEKGTFGRDVISPTIHEVIPISEVNEYDAHQPDPKIIDFIKSSTEKKISEIMDQISSEFEKLPGGKKFDLVHNLLGKPSDYVNDMSVDNLWDARFKINSIIGDLAKKVSSEYQLGKIPHMMWQKMVPKLAPAIASESIFSDIRNYLRKNGYNAITHEGGLIHGGDPHKVTIFLNPEKDLDLKTVASLPDVDTNKYEYRDVKSRELKKERKYIQNAMDAAIQTGLTVDPLNPKDTSTSKMALAELLQTRKKALEELYKKSLDGFSVVAKGDEPNGISILKEIQYVNKKLKELETEAVNINKAYDDALFSRYFNTNNNNYNSQTREEIEYNDKSSNLKPASYYNRDKSLDLIDPYNKKMKAELESRIDALQKIVDQYRNKKVPMSKGQQKRLFDLAQMKSLLELRGYDNDDSYENSKLQSQVAKKIKPNYTPEELEEFITQNKLKAYDFNDPDSEFQLKLKKIPDNQWRVQPKLPGIKEEAHTAQLKYLPDNSYAGSADFRAYDTNNKTANIEVLPEHQRQYLGNAIYRAIENYTGNPMHPSHLQLDDGRKFWANPNRPWGRPGNVYKNQVIDALKNEKANQADEVLHYLKRKSNPNIFDPYIDEYTINALKNFEKIDDKPYIDTLLNPIYEKLDTLEKKAEDQRSPELNKAAYEKTQELKTPFKSTYPTNVAAQKGLENWRKAEIYQKELDDLLSVYEDYKPKMSFNPNSTGLPDFDKVTEGYMFPYFRNEKNWSSHKVNLSPMEVMSYSNNALRGMWQEPNMPTLSPLRTRRNNPENLQKLSQIENLDMPIIGFGKGIYRPTQEGYHRALAAYRSGLKEIPVTVLGDRDGVSFPDKIVKKILENQTPEEKTRLLNPLSSWIEGDLGWQNNEIRGLDPAEIGMYASEISLPKREDELKEILRRKTQYDKDSIWHQPIKEELENISERKNLGYSRWEKAQKEFDENILNPALEQARSEKMPTLSQSRAVQPVEEVAQEVNKISPKLNDIEVNPRFGKPGQFTSTPYATAAEDVLTHPAIKKLALASVGAGLVGLDAYNRYKRGDDLGAGITAGGAALYGVNPLLGAGATATNAIRDRLNANPEEKLQYMKQDRISGLPAELQYDPGSVLEATEDLDKKQAEYDAIKKLKDWYLQQ